MGKTRDHFKKIRDAKGTFHAKMGTIKDRNGRDLKKKKKKRKKENPMNSMERQKDRTLKDELFR